MDGREIRWELAGLTADQERARKSRDVNMAGGKTAAAQIDQLEADRQQVRARLLEERLEHLEVRVRSTESWFPAICNARRACL